MNTSSTIVYMNTKLFIFHILLLLLLYFKLLNYITTKLFLLMQANQDALYWACRKAQWDIAEYLLLKEANPDIKDNVSAI